MSKNDIILSRIPHLTPETVQVAVQHPWAEGMSGWVQVDEMSDEGNVFSSNPEQMIELGFPMPTTAELMTLPEGRYSLAKALNLLKKDQPMNNESNKRRTEPRWLKRGEKQSQRVDKTIGKMAKDKNFRPAPFNKEDLNKPDFDLDAVLPVSEDGLKSAQTYSRDAVTDAGDAVSQLKDIQEQMLELLSQAESILRDVGGLTYTRASRYWIPTIQGALSKEQSGGSGPMFDMDETISELSGGENEDDGEGDDEPDLSTPEGRAASRRRSAESVREDWTAQRVRFDDIPTDTPPDAGVDTMHGVDDVFGRDTDGEPPIDDDDQVPPPGTDDVFGGPAEHSEQSEVELAQEITDYSNVLLNDEELRATLPEHAFELLGQIVAKAGAIVRMHSAAPAMEGAGEAGFDVPHDEGAEVELGRSILTSLETVGREIHQKLGFDTSLFSKLQRIEAAAKQLISMHQSSSPQTGQF